MTKEMAEVAATWWSDKLESCKNSGLSAEERRDPSNRGYVMAEMLMTMAKPKVSEEQVELFRDTLVSRLLFENPRCVCVDYGPDVILRDVLDAAHIGGGMGTLPIKTTMWFGDNDVRVRYGYGAEVKTIYPIG